MKYTYDNSISLSLSPQEYTKNSSREVLQYAVGGLLYTPAYRTKVAEDIITGKHPEFRSICLDLEDSVGDDVVEQSEKGLCEILVSLVSAIADGDLTYERLPLIFIRARNGEHLRHIGDIMDDDMLTVLTGFCLPKFDKTNCDSYIEAFCEIQHRTREFLYIMPIIESKPVMYKQHRIEQLIYMRDCLSAVADHVLNVRVGGTDFCGLFGIRRGMEDSIYDVKVVADCFTDVINMFGANYICSGPVWEYFDSTGKEGPWSDGLKNELRMDKLNGFIGKTCIHPSQLRFIAESNIVSYAEYQDAISILGMGDGIAGVAKGYGSNKMNEVKTHTNWARKIVGRASVYGVEKEK